MARDSSVALTATAAICMGPEYTRPPTEVTPYRKPRSGFDGEDEQTEQAVGLGVRVLGQPRVHRPGLDHGAARSGQPAEPRPERLPPGGTRTRLGRTDVGGRLQRAPDRIGVRARGQRPQPVVVEVHAGTEVVTLPAVDEDAGVQ